MKLVGQKVELPAGESARMEAAIVIAGKLGEYANKKAENSETALYIQLITNACVIILKALKEEQTSVDIEEGFTSLFQAYVDGDLNRIGGGKLTF